ncbi:putative calcium-dependent protein kinase [Cryptosporidium serpentis]
MADLKCVFNSRQFLLDNESINSTGNKDRIEAPIEERRESEWKLVENMTSEILARYESDLHIYENNPSISTPSPCSQKCFTFETAEEEDSTIFGLNSHELNGLVTSFKRNFEEATSTSQCQNEDNGIINEESKNEYKEKVLSSQGFSRDKNDINNFDESGNLNRDRYLVTSVRPNSTNSSVHSNNLKVCNKSVNKGQSSQNIKYPSCKGLNTQRRNRIDQNRYFNLGNYMRKVRQDQNITDSSTNYNVNSIQFNNVTPGINNKDNQKYCYDGNYEDSNSQVNSGNNIKSDFSKTENQPSTQDAPNHHEIQEISKIKYATETSSLSSLETSNMESIYENSYGRIALYSITNENEIVSKEVTCEVCKYSYNCYQRYQEIHNYPGRDEMYVGSKVEVSADINNSDLPAKSSTLDNSVEKLDFCARNEHCRVFWKEDYNLAKYIYCSPNFTSEPCINSKVDSNSVSCLLCKERKSPLSSSRSSECPLKEGKFRRDGLIPACKGSIHIDYMIDMKSIGKGTYGSVCCGVNRLTGAVRAIKSIPLAKVKAMDRFMKEINIMKNLDHPNIVKLYETYQDHKNIYLVLEFCSGGELFDRIIQQGNFDEAYAAYLMRQIFSAIFYCHEHGIVHRDLKPENFLFLNNQNNAPLKIIDFGLATKFNKINTTLTTRAGTPYYVAPEVLSGEYDQQCDLWSLGVILYILLCGYPPFYGSNDNIILQKVKTGYFIFKDKDWKDISPLAKDLICKLLTYNPKGRICARDALQHPWITHFTKNNYKISLYCLSNETQLKGSEADKECNQEFSNLSSYRTGTCISSGINILSNFRNFHQYNRFKKVALTVIAQQMTESQISNLKEAFFALDANGDGTLTPQEIILGLQKSGIKELPSDLIQILQDIDSDGSGSIDYTEFIAATLDSRQCFQENICWAAFRVFDLDGNGKITASEIMDVIGCHHLQHALHLQSYIMSTIEDMIREVDVNGDGEIDFEEFLEMFKRCEKV